MSEQIIPPTVGRMVHFIPKESSYQFGYSILAGKPHAAVVTAVHGHRMVNLSVFDCNGKHFARTSVRLRQPDDPVPVNVEDYCEWMPYQIQTTAAQPVAKPSAA